MQRRGARLATAVAGACLLWPFAAADAQPRIRSEIARDGNALAPPAQGDALEIARAHLLAEREALGLESRDVERAALTARHRQRNTGVEHLFFRQQLHGLPVIGADLGISIDASGRVLARWSRAIAALDAPSPRPRRSADEALASAIAALGLPAPEELPTRLEERGGAAREQIFAPGAYSLDPVPVRLVFLAQDGSTPALAWNLVLRDPSGQHWWDAYVDAGSGALLEVHDWIDRESYRVYPLPVESPAHGLRTLLVDPALPSASPFGWHDDDGIAGAEYSDTRGNNVRAQEDTNANDSGGFRPSSATLDFDFALDLEQAPSGYQSAAITQLFYGNNVAHDLFHHYGFDEAAGNFQTDNYGNGGVGGDAVRADAQDGSDVNNANFGTPPDGSPPRMQMFVWNPLAVHLTVGSPAALAGPRIAGPAAFGPALTTTGVTGDLARADPADACTALVNPGAIAGHIALVDRGDCLFSLKVENSETAGAIGVVVVNNQHDETLTMGGSSSTAIPSLLVGLGDGEALVQELALGGSVSATLERSFNRDSDLDALVVIHEYAHGVTNRLSGGPANVNCLDSDSAGGMGEGWSDFFGLAFTATPGDLGSDFRGVGGYLEGASGGIRSFPYSIDFALNPLTYEDSETQGVPHGVGEVWAIALWEAYWELVDAYGFDPDWIDGDGGNQRALARVMEGLSLQPCLPTFIDARDAVLAADQAATGGEDECLLWDAFARRGLGENASDDTVVSIAVTEDFSVPLQCQEYCGDGVVQGAESCDDGNRLDFDGCHSVCLPEDDFTLVGTAQGGSVGLRIEGVLVTVQTSAGQSAEDVLEALAAAIEAEPALASQGISARVENGVLTTGGEIDSTQVNDPGFASNAIPAFPPLAGAVLAIALSTIARRRLASEACAAR